MNDDKPASGPSFPDCLEAAEPAGKSKGVGTRQPWVQASALPLLTVQLDKVT